MNALSKWPIETAWLDYFLGGENNMTMPGKLLREAFDRMISV